MLEAAVALVDEMYASGEYPEGADIAARAGTDMESAAAALHALAGEYLELQPTGDPSSWGVPWVTGEARRAVGQWPTGESLAERLVAALEQAAEQESDPGQKSRLQGVARGLAGVARDIFVSVASQALGQRIPR